MCAFFFFYWVLIIISLPPPPHIFVHRLTVNWIVCKELIFLPCWIPANPAMWNTGTYRAVQLSLAYCGKGRLVMLPILPPKQLRKLECLTMQIRYNCTIWMDSLPFFFFSSWCKKCPFMLSSETKEEQKYSWTLCIIIDMLSSCFHRCFQFSCDCVYCRASQFISQIQIILGLV